MTTQQMLLMADNMNMLRKCQRPALVILQWNDLTETMKTRFAAHMAIWIRWNIGQGRVL